MNSIAKLSIVCFFIIFSSCKKEKDHSIISIHSSYGKSDTAGHVNGRALLTFIISDAANFDFLEIRKYSNDIEQPNAFVKLTKFDIEYEWNNEFKYVYELPLIQNDVDKENKIKITVYDNDAIQDKELNYIVLPSEPSIGLWLGRGSTTGIAGDELIYVVKLNASGGIKKYYYEKYVNDVIINVFEDDQVQNDITYRDSLLMDRKFTHIYKTDEEDQITKYIFYLEDFDEQKVSKILLIKTLPPLPIKSTLNIITPNFPFDNRYICYSTKTLKFYKYNAVLESVELQELVDIFIDPFNGAITSPSKNELTNKWTIRNETGFKSTSIELQKEGSAPFYDYQLTQENYNLLNNAYYVFDLYDISENSSDGTAVRAYSSKHSQGVIYLDSYYTEADYSSETYTIKLGLEKL